jgi:hypothetical protein
LVFEQYRYFEHFELNIDHRLRCRFKNYRSYLVGTCLWNASVFPTVSMTCASRDFYSASHRELYYARCKAGRQIKSMMGLHDQGAIVS